MGTCQQAVWFPLGHPGLAPDCGASAARDSCSCLRAAPHGVGGRASGGPLQGSGGPRGRVAVSCSLQKGCGQACCDSDRQLPHSTCDGPDVPKKVDVSTPDLRLDVAEPSCCSLWQRGEGYLSLLRGCSKVLPDPSSGAHSLCGWLPLLPDLYVEDGHIDGTI